MTLPPKFGHKHVSAATWAFGGSHKTLYLDKATQRVIKEIALQYDKEAHDLYLEA